MKRETRITILKDIYQDSAGISDDELYDEAIATLENYFSALVPGELYHRSRVDVIAYLALLNERERAIPIDWILKEIENPENPDQYRDSLSDMYYAWKREREKE